MVCCNMPWVFDPWFLTILQGSSNLLLGEDARLQIAQRQVEVTEGETYLFDVMVEHGYGIEGLKSFGIEY
ncbi:MAG: hypothetical protein AABX65_00110 [Nanoarchaeota archaeon]